MNETQSERDPLDQLAESFLARYRAGECPPLTEYTTQHPELADEIRELFPALVAMERARPHVGSGNGKEASVAEIPAKLGDYRIIKEIGRGGMGVVYEAIQESLHRHVALKVLPFHSWVKPTHLERFQREAQAAARLHHTNIVPVFGVGEAEGIHFYAMQFIHGQSIDSVLEEVKRLRRQTGLGTMPDGSRMEEPAHSQNESVAVSVAESLLLGRFSDSEPKSTRTESIKPRHNVQELPGLSGASKTQPPPPSASPLSHLERAEILEKAMNGGEQGREEETDKGRPDSVPASALPPLTPGSDLTTLVESKYYRSVAQIGIQVAEALAYAHGQGVLHRDIKPSNLLLDTAGRVWITDFGLAKTEDSEELTSPGDMVGTLRYMAPERLRGQADPRSDVYSLGVTLYEMLTLQPAFQDSSRAALIDQITTTPAKSPRRIDPHIPRDLETMVLKAIAKEPNKRYASAGEMAEDLRRFLADRPIRARRASVLEQSWRWSRRNPALAATAGLAATALTAAAVLGFSLALQQHNAAERLGEEQRQTVAALTQVLQEKQQTQAAFNEAEIQKRTAERLSATYALDQGISLCERGDVALGMLWLTHSLRIMPDHAPELQHAIRANLAGWKRELRPLKALLKHDDAVWAIAYSPDGELILTGGWDKQARLWNANTGAPIGDPWPHEGYVWSVAFSPDCHRAVIGADGGAQMWDIAKGERIGKPLRSENSAGPVAFSPDGQSVFTAYGNGKVQRWDAATGEYRGDVCSHGDRVYCLAAYGRTIVTGGEDNCARLWDVDTGQAVGDPLCHQGVVRAVAFSHNGLQILTASFDGFGRLWQAATQKPIGLPLAHHDKVISVAFSQDDRLVLTGSDDGTAQIWDAATCQRLGPPLKHRSQVSAVAFNPKGSSFATGGTENVVRLWDTRQESWTRPEVTLPHDNKVRGLAVSPDGRLLLTAGENGTCWVWDLDKPCDRGKPLRQHRGLVRAVAVSPDGTLLLTGSDDRTAQLWDSATLRPVGVPIPHPSPIRAVAFSPDGGTILAGDVEGNVWRTERTSPERPEVFFQHPAWVNGLAWSPDGKMIASAGLDKKALLWDALTGQPLGAPLKHGDAVWVVAFSRDSHSILTGSWDGTARLWDVATQTPRGAPLQHGAKVEAAAISPDGHTIVTAGLDGRARLWDAATGIPIGPSLIHRDMVVAAAFNPDGQSVVTGSLDHAARIWPVPSPIEGTVSDLVIQTQLLTGLQLQPGGAAVSLDPRVWSRYRDLPLYSLQIALFPLNPEPYYQRALIYKQLRLLRKAIDDCSMALQLCSGNSELECRLRSLRGQIYLPLREYGLAVPDLERALELDSNNSSVLNNLAWAFVMGPVDFRDAERALPLALKAVSLPPDSCDHLNTLGLVFYRLGQYSQAISKLEKSLLSNPTPPLDLFALSMCHARLGEPDKARADYDRAVHWLQDQKEPLSPWDVADIKGLREEADQVLAESSDAEANRR